MAPNDNLPDTLQDGISHLERRKHTLGGYISNVVLYTEASKFRQSRSRWNPTGWIDVSCWPFQRLWGTLLIVATCVEKIPWQVFKS